MPRNTSQTTVPVIASFASRQKAPSSDRLHREQPRPAPRRQSAAPSSAQAPPSRDESPTADIPAPTDATSRIVSENPHHGGPRRRPRSTAPTIEACVIDPVGPRRALPLERLAGTLSSSDCPSQGLRATEWRRASRARARSKGPDCRRPDPRRDCSRSPLGRLFCLWNRVRCQPRDVARAQVAETGRGGGLHEEERGTQALMLTAAPSAGTG